MLEKQNKKQKKIIVIPGIFDIQYECKPLYRIARQMGFEVLIFHYTPWGHESYFSIETKLEALIKLHKPAGIVGYSHGGALAVGAKHSLSIFSVGGTFSGTLAGYLWHTIGFRQIRYNSEYLLHIQTAIARRLRSEDKSIVSVYTPFDVTIIPFTSSKAGESHLAFALTHQFLCFSSKTQRTYREWLSSLQ